MPVQFVNPEGITKPTSYSQVAIATGTKIIFISGQVALDEDGNLVGKGDLSRQTEQAYLNIAAALAGVGASFDDVAKVTIYVVGWTPDKMEPLVAGAMRAVEKIGFDPRKAMTLVGVATLASPDLLIEVEVTAVLP
ncbi:MAG: RidA family protein [Burkholderiales bacterium]|nr:RidA family protein [Burkholderiales bacterium]